MFNSRGLNVWQETLSAALTLMEKTVAFVLQ